MKLELTDSVVRRLTAADKKYTVWNTADDPAGLAIRVRSSGTKTYVLIARPAYVNRPVTVTLGRAKTMKLGVARKKAHDALLHMQNGTNPNNEKKKLKIETFGALANLYMTEESPKKRQGKAAARYLRSDWLGQVSHRTRVWERGRHVLRTEWSNRKDLCSVIDLLHSSPERAYWQD